MCSSRVLWTESSSLACLYLPRWNVDLDLQLLQADELEAELMKCYMKSSSSNQQQRLQGRDEATCVQQLEPEPAHFTLFCASTHGASTSNTRGTPEKSNKIKRYWEQVHDWTPRETKPNRMFNFCVRKFFKKGVRTGLTGFLVWHRTHLPAARWPGTATGSGQCE